MCKGRPPGERKSLPSLELDRSLKAHVALPESARRDPPEYRMDVRARHPSPCDDTVHIVLPARVVRRPLNHRLERLAPMGVRDLVAGDEVRHFAVVDATEDLARQ